ncbi:MAG: alanine racemase [Cyanobium sp. Prado107]|nr:alanine racemase [Cyanobium sp. Prado107]
MDALRRVLPARTRLLAVSKGQQAALVREAVAAGQRSFAESRLQEAVAKQAELADLEPLDWHFIGRLQANKARGVLRHFGTIHSVDSLALARRLARIAAEEGLSPAVYYQVKLRPDPAKTGFAPEELRAGWADQVKLRPDPAKTGFAPEELRAGWADLTALAPLRGVGLMTIAPLGLDAAGRLALFRDCAALAAELGLTELSMGMSGDWREAAQAGSTWVRIGTALFGPRATGPG